MSQGTFTTGSTMRHVVVMTATASVGLMALFLVDAINLFYISLLGVTELAAAIGFAGSIQFFMISLSIGLMIAGSATVSRAIGAGDRAAARRMATSGMVTAVLLMGVIAALVWIWRVEALRLLGAKGAALEQAGAFLAIVLPSLPLLAVGMAAGGTLRAIGEARRAMYVTLGGGALAAVIDPILIFGLDLGLTGAAIATVAVRFCIAGIGLWFVIGRHDMLAPPRLGDCSTDLPPLLAIALPAMATQLSTPFGNAYLTTTVAEHGDGAVAGWAVVGRLTALAFAGIFSLAGAVGPIVGQNAGAGLSARIVATFRDALIFAGVYVLTVWLVLWLMADFVVLGFGLDPDGAKVVHAFIRYGAGAFLFTGALFVTNATFNNLGRPHWSTLCNWSRDAIAIPVLAILLGGAGVAAAVWIQAIAAIAVGTGATLICWRFIIRAHDRARPAPGPAPAPAFTSGRAAVSLVGSTEPLASEDENR